MKKFNHCFAALLALLSLSVIAQPKTKPKPSFSGIYPHLAMYNNEGECGTGAVVGWAGKLWAITYAPHLPFGSSDKLYEIGTDLTQTVRPESIGGTPANRMIHQESNQLFIGPYAIDGKGNVKTISYTTMPGRHTGNARHLTDPANKIYFGTMEEGFYEVDVKTLAVKTLYEDGNVKNNKRTTDKQTYQYNGLLPGTHGKGYYSGQGVTVYSNNGEPGKLAEKQFDIESGSLSEWDGKDWKVVRRNQFVEVTGPGGILGNKNPATDPIWATGWDHKSVLLGVRDNGKWTFFRLPKASHSYDGAHGWNTEWPRIRDVGTETKPDYLMTMHGMFWEFPGHFSSKNTAGIRPRTSYLKVIGDFTRWKDQLVFGCDDSAQREFLNKRKAKGNIEGPGQSNSNLWFTSLNQPDQLGPNTAEGAVWLNEKIAANATSEPFLFSGWANRSAWIQNNGDAEVTFTFEVDKNGNGLWTNLKTLKVGAKKAANIQFAANDGGEWIRIKADKPTNASAHFSYIANDPRKTAPDAIFAGLSDVTAPASSGGLLYGLGDNRRALGVAAMDYSAGKPTLSGYYELDADMNLVRKEDAKTLSFIQNKFAIPQKVVTVDESSVLVVDDKGRRWRLPLGDNAFTGLTNDGALRVCREVSTERDLFNCHGTFYELPAENADGYAKIRPVSSHNLRINDYASYRGLLVMTGVDAKNLKGNKHIVASSDNKAAVWAGAIDDLWKLGKPTGHGGPWKDAAVKANAASDPYLIGFYDKKSLKLSHKANNDVTFTMEVDPVGNGPWMEARQFTVKAGETFTFDFPKDFGARWVRFKTDKDCVATTWLDYK
ncbi:hypothetical protein [Dyadobacter chenhuakuii]|uniref:Uncharacterized protein n=1 Tax=Dyadobacter chenhuakuii TaxID=2909339 RepID=A0ABY4XP53_9BACT|nr:hypothetical protein [Dyadobacter chenhuakuii]MCF2494440.1 hypothetical protein [Dyadobacter chenhuakuii]USJ32234.1 hypothetical protein NFI80_05710 [Dyadobacter chenhuakuii]